MMSHLTGGIYANFCCVKSPENFNSNGKSCFRPPIRNLIINPIRNTSL